MSPSRNTKKKNNKTSRARFMEISRDSATGLSAMQQRMIRQHACQHSFSHRYGANADAGVVAARGADRRLLTVHIDSLARRQNRRRRFHREARDDLLARGDAAQNSTRMVGEKFGFAFRAFAHLVCVLFAA